MQRHTAENPCVVCGGHPKLPQGQGIRCHGFVGTDGWVHCAREGGGRAPYNNESLTWAHKAVGKCPCGATHGDDHDAITQHDSPIREIGEAKSARVVAIYDYQDERGRVLFQVVRKEPKAFVQKRPDGQWGRGDARLVPYRLPEVINAVAAGDRVWICEGEKDVEAMRAAGCVATCNAGGAGKWLPDFARYLDGADITIVEDRDEPGRNHARQVFSSLRGVARSVRVVQAAAGKDAADHFAAGKTTEEFVPVYPVDSLRDSDPVAWKRAILARSLEVREQPIAMVDPDAALKQAQSPSWPTALEGKPTILTAFRGVTFMVGGPSAGKSWWAIGSSLSAAYSGWRVLYVASEMSPAQILRRAMRYTDDHLIPDGFDVIEASYGASVERLVEMVSAAIDERKTLIVLDSISSFVDQAEVADSPDDAHKIGPLKRLTMWALNVRRDTNGEVSFLVLSERNAAGETKGRFGDHKADLVVSIKSDEKTSLGKHIVVTKAWESECGPLGLFALDPKRARLTWVGD